jgi:hypothetical protein
MFIIGERVIKQMTNYKFKERGQVALIVLLVSAIVLSLGLSVSRKTTVETKVDTDEELLKQAFNTAESSIDKYLMTGEKNYSGGVDESATVVSLVIGNGTSLVSESLTEGKPAFFWLAGHNADGSINLAVNSGGDVLVCPVTSFRGALKIDYYYKSGINYMVSRSGYNYKSAGFVTGYVDSSNDCVTVTGQGNLVTNLLLAITPIFNTGSSTVITVTRGIDFPAQGEDLTATGRVGDQTIGVSRKVRVRTGYKIPAFMLDALTTLQ